MSELVLVEDRGPIRRVTLNRPDKLNALNQELTDSLSIALGKAAESDEVRVVVIAGSGRSFCAGYDLEEGSSTERAAILKSLTHSLERLLEVFDHPKPVVAEVQGHCLAGGCDLMMMCDLAVASDDAVFGQPEIRFGSTVVAHVMPWLIGARKAKELILTGTEIDAIEAERIGLVNRVVPRDQLGDETMRLARELAVVDPVAMRLTKRAINRSWAAAGFRQALQEGVEIGAEIESARVPEREEFERIATERGLKEALRWRDERFDAND
ncbi:MAG TPA: enoyl-CoA hydratase-related protein [Acidimicrobiia bacterium]|nr:enoyl-CoA hydratase-related protein [Acidimicrobiia bacterium]